MKRNHHETSKKERVPNTVLDKSSYWDFRGVGARAWGEKARATKGNTLEGGLPERNYLKSRTGGGRKINNGGGGLKTWSRRGFFLRSGMGLEQEGPW